MVCIYEYAFSIFVIHYVEETATFSIFSNDDHVARSETTRCNVAVVQFLLHKCHRLTAVHLHFLDNADHKLDINICSLLNFFCVIIRLRTLHTVMQILAHLVLAQFMCRRPFLGIFARCIGKLLVQTG